MRSLLFVPADSDRKIAKGLASAADALILDLEDSVALENKPKARRLCAEVLASAQTSKKLFVRINAFDTPQALSDLAAVVRARPAGIMLPKCRGGEDVRLLSNYLTALEARDELAPEAIRILPIVTETGAAMFGLGSYNVGQQPRLCGMLWGGEDLAAEIGATANRDASGRYSAAFELARSLCVLGAAAASVIAVDAVYTDFRDLKGLEAEALAGVRTGFSAKALIHPDQAEVVNRAFTPSAEALQWARQVMAAFEANPGAGVVSIDGKMIDRPHHKAALRVLARSQASAS